MISVRTHAQHSGQFGVKITSSDGTQWYDEGYGPSHFGNYINLFYEDGVIVGRFKNEHDLDEIYTLELELESPPGYARVEIADKVCYVTTMAADGVAATNLLDDYEDGMSVNFNGRMGITAQPTYLHWKFQGDPAWLMTAEGGGGGTGGVDANDWDYWFDNEIGKFHNIHDGLVAYFGNGETEGQVATDMATIVDKLDVIAYALSSPVPIVNTDFVMPEIDEEELDFEIDTKLDEVKDLFTEIEINETESADDEVEIVLPLESWLSYFDSGIQDITLSVETGPFQSVKAPLAIIIYALLSLWAILFIFNEFRRTG